MNNLVKKIKWNLPNSPETEMYMYGNASIEANQEMQEPLEKLYQYENQLKELYSILENLTEYLESHTDIKTNWVIADEVFDYTDEMWKIFGINDCKQKREELYEEMLNGE